MNSICINCINVVWAASALHSDVPVVNWRLETLSHAALNLVMGGETVEPWLHYRIQAVRLSQRGAGIAHC